MALIRTSNTRDRRLLFLLLVSCCPLDGIARGTDASAALASAAASAGAAAGAGIHGEAVSDRIDKDLRRRRGLQEDGGEALADEQLQHQRRQLQQDLDRDTNRPPAWYGRFDPTYKLSYFAQSMSENKCDSKDCSALPGKTYPYHSIVINPLDPMGDQPVMKIEYPKGSWSPSADIPGGTLMWAYPYKYNPKDVDGAFSAVSAALQFEVYFPEDFDFVKGGKLLGLSGSVGGGKNGRGCGGGADAIANKCFSFRSMWRRDGQGEAYLYVPQGRQASGFCPQEGRSSGVNGGFPGCTTRGPYPCTECNNKAGYSFGRGSFKFRRGEWNKIHMSLTLNTAGQADGKIEMQHNGVTVLSYDKMVWRLSPEVYIQGIEICSWFGGSDASWGPPKDTYTLVRNIRAWRGALLSAADSRLDARPPAPQVVLVESVDVGE